MASWGLGPRLTGRRSREVLHLLGFLAAAVAWGFPARWTSFGSIEAVAWAAPAAWGALVLARIRRGLWPLYSVSLLLATLAFRVAAGQPVDVSAAYGLANLVQGLVFAWLVTRFAPDVIHLDRLRRVADLVIVSAVAALVAGLVLAPTLWAVGTAPGDAALLGLIRAGAVLLGLLTLGPAVFLGARAVLEALTRGPVIAWLAAAEITLWLGFGAMSPGYPYLPLVVTLLAVGQYGLEVGAVLPLFTVPLATWLTTTGQGPWGQLELPFSRPLAAQGYALTLTVGSLLVGALVTERRTALDRVIRANESLESTVAERTRDLLAQSRRSEAVADLGRAMAEARLDESAIWRAVADRVGRMVGDVCVISRVDRDVGALTPVAVGGPDPALVEASRTAFTGLSMDGEETGLTVLAVRTATPVLRSGTAAEIAAISHPQLRDFVRRTGLHAAAIVPVLDEGQVVATLSLHRHTTPVPFGPADVTFLQELAGRAALSVTNARLHARAEALARRLEGLSDAGVAGIFAVDGDHVCEANDAFLALVGRDRAALDAGLIRWPALLGAAEHEHPDEPAPPQLATPQLATPQPPTPQPATPRHTTLTRLDGTQVPVLLAGAHLDGEGPSWIGLAIDRTEARDAEQAMARRAVHAELLAQCSRLAQDTGTLDDAALDLMARRSSAALGGGLAVLLDHDGQVNTVAVAHTDARIEVLQRDLLDQSPPTSGQGDMGRAIATGERVVSVIDAAVIQRRVAPAWADYLSLVSGSTAAYLPLRARGKVLGIVYAQRSPGYLPDELDFLGDLAERIALAINNGRLQQAEREARRELAASEERFRSALDGLVDPVLIMSPVLDDEGSVHDFLITYVNAAQLAAGGSPQGAYLARRSLNLETPRLVVELAEVLRTGTPLHWDRSPWRRAGRDPEIGYGDIRGIRIGGEVMVSWRDVTDQVMAERDLARSEQLLRLAFDESPIGGALIDLEGDRLGRLLKVNQALSVLSGHPDDVLTGADGTILTHPEDREAERLILAELAAGSRAHVQQERRLMRADGTVAWVRISAAAIQRDGRPWYAVEHLEDVTDRKHAEQELVRRALYDPLTGLGNRHLLMDHLGLALKGLDRQDGVVAVLYLDLDRFKQINDTLGHDAGDEAIRQVGARLRATVRAPDTAARIGGDEFVVVSANLTDEGDALPIADRIQEVLSEPIHLQGQRIDAKASIGVVTTRSSAADPGELLHRADLAMYQAKQRREGRTAVYSETLGDPARHRNRVEQDLRRALEDGGLRLHYQPIIDLSDNRIVGAEALLRLDHPERGLLLPEEFIDVAEDSDLILPIGEWVISHATAQMAAWRRLHADLTVAVNVSARQTRRPGVAQHILAAARASSADPAGLSVEMTERVLINADQSVVRDLNRLADLGVTLALDDFGTGYSSLTYLKQLPVHSLKIDRSFITGLDRRPDDTAIVEAVTALARALQLGTVAEGVEHPRQLDALRRLGCERAQGFHLSPPLSAEQFTVVLRTHRALPA